MITETTSGKVVFNLCTLHLSFMMTYLNINGESFMLFSILLFIDYITGILKAKALGKSITSNRMKYGVISKLSLLIIPVVLAIGAKAIGTDFKTILLVGINILVLSEVYSIIGNLYSIRTHDELPEYDVVAMLGKKVRNILLKYSEE